VREKKARKPSSIEGKKRWEKNTMGRKRKYDVMGPSGEEKYASNETEERVVKTRSMSLKGTLGKRTTLLSQRVNCRQICLQQKKPR